MDESPMVLVPVLRFKGNCCSQAVSGTSRHETHNSIAILWALSVGIICPSRHQFTLGLVGNACFTTKRSN